MTTNGSRTRIQSIDGLRAVSILFVILAHIAGTKHAPFQGGLMAQYLGNLGVRVFFIISGFLITSLLMREQDRAGQISLAQFYKRRVLRIFPVFYSYLVVVAVLTVLGVLVIPKNQFLSACTFTANIWKADWNLGHLWSLSVEEQFYLVWPLAMISLGRAWCLRIALAIVCAGPILSAYFWYIHAAIPASMLFNFAPIAAGSAFALYRARLHRSELYMRLIHMKTITWLVPAAALFLSFLRGPFGLHTLVSGAAAFLLVAFIDQTTLISNQLCRLLNWPPIAFAGTLSYSLYVWQQLFLDGTHNRLINLFPLNVIFAVACALISYFVIELPFIRLKNQGNFLGGPQLRKVVGSPHPLAQTLTPEIAKGTSF